MEISFFAETYNYNSSGSWSWLLNAAILIFQVMIAYFVYQITASKYIFDKQQSLSKLEVEAQVQLATIKKTEVENQLQQEDNVYKKYSDEVLRLYQIIDELALHLINSNVHKKQKRFIFFYLNPIPQYLYDYYKERIEHIMKNRYEEFDKDIIGTLEENSLKNIEKLLQKDIQQNNQQQ